MLTVVRGDLCVSCGHCAAVCPQNAIGPNPERTDGRFALQDFTAAENPMADLLRRKRSVRHFSGENLPRDLIDRIVAYGEQAPSSHNFRIRRYYVVSDPVQLGRIEKAIAKTYGTLVGVLNPLTLGSVGMFDKAACRELRTLVRAFRHMIAEVRKGNTPVFRSPAFVVFVGAPAGSHHSKDDCVAAQHYMMLYAKSVGVESFICGYPPYAHKAVGRILGVEKGFKVFTASAFGRSHTEFLRSVRYAEPVVSFV